MVVLIHHYCLIEDEISVTLHLRSVPQALEFASTF